MGPPEEVRGDWAKAPKEHNYLWAALSQRTVKQPFTYKTQPKLLYSVFNWELERAMYAEFHNMYPTKAKDLNVQFLLGIDLQ